MSECCIQTTCYMLLILLLVSLIPDCYLFNPAYHIMYSACKLNMQGDNIQLQRIPFPNFEPVHFSVSSSNCCFLIYIQVSQEAGKVVWYSHLFKNFPQFVVIHIIKGFSIVSEAEVDIFSGTPLLSLWSNGFWQFDLWSLCIFYIQLEHLEVSSSCTVEALTGRIFRIILLEINTH